MLRFPVSLHMVLNFFGAVVPSVLPESPLSDLSADIARRIQDEMTYPGQVKITVIRETRSVSYAK